MPDLRPLEIREEAELWAGADHNASQVTATVVIPVYCADATLARAARSALSQSLEDIELILVDDGSTDGSWEIIADLLRADARVRGLRHRGNRGKSVAMNRAMALTRGRWMAVLDADDWYHPDRLRHLISLGEARQADLVADNQFLFDAAAGQVVGTAWQAAHSWWNLDFDDFLIGSDAYQSFNLGMLKPVLRTDFMREAALRYEESARQGEDFFHLLQFYLAGGRAVISDTPYYFYTQPFGAVSRQWSHAGRSRYDFQNAHDITLRYLDRAALSGWQRRRLTARQDRLQSLEIYFRAKSAFEKRDWRAAAALIGSHPGALFYLLRRLYGRLLPQAPRGIQRLAERARRRIYADQRGQ